MSTNFALDGMFPQTVYEPRDAAELAPLLAQCNAQNCAVVPWGGGTLQHLGNAPTRYEAAISTRNLNQVVEYAADDLTITVGAGMTLANIERVLGENGQFLPLDVPHPSRATIGGVLAAGANGPLRLRYGPARDYMLGNKFATVDGHIIKAGSRVVKNVAGYELHKVQVGALGTLGILTEATFKVFPKPLVELAMWLAFDDWQNACASVPGIWDLATPPLAIELLDADNARRVQADAQANWCVVARFGGSKATMAAARDLSVQVAQENSARSVDVLDDSAMWRTLADLPATMREASPDALCVRVSVPPRELQNALRAAFDTANTQNLAPPRIFAHAALATLYVSVDGDAATLETFAISLRAAVHKLRGYMMVERAPSTVKKLDAWDDAEATLKLMRSIKHKFDPHNILNPGRFVGGF